MKRVKIEAHSLESGFNCLGIFDSMEAAVEFLGDDLNNFVEVGAVFPVLKAFVPINKDQWFAGRDKLPTLCNSIQIVSMELS